MFELLNGGSEVDGGWCLVVALRTRYADAEICR